MKKDDEKEVKEEKEDEKKEIKDCKRQSKRHGYERRCCCSYRW